MILVFDADCVVCSHWVTFILRYDQRRKIRFASTQSATGRRLLVQAGLDPDDPSSLLLVDGERTWQQTAAIFRVIDSFGGAWRLGWGGWLVPAPLRNAGYRYIARNRYRLFGRRDSCYLPRPDEAWRFLD